MFAAKNERFTLCVLPDDDPESPRLDGNFGRMVCFHPRYQLGDQHEYKDARAFLSDIYVNGMKDGGRGLLRFLKDKKAESAYLYYNRHTQMWELYEKCDWRTVIGNSEPEWECVQSAPRKELNHGSWFWDEMLDVLTTGDLIKLIGSQRGTAILPLYLYDHSGLTMNTTGFSCRWDSGQVGWIYADREAIREAFGRTDKRAMDRAERALLAEVREYDDYLRGECYGYRLYEGNDEVDSCWGFIGEPATAGIRDNLPAEAQSLVDELVWTEQNEDAYLACV